MKQYSIRSNGSTIFDVFVRAVYYEKSIEFRGHVLRLINGILNSLETLNDRVDARYALSDLGFIQIIEEMKTKLIELDNQRQKSRFLKKQSSIKGLPAKSSIDSTISTDSTMDNLTDDEMDEDDQEDEDEEITLIKDQIKLYEKRQSDDDLQCMFESVNLSDADGMFAFLLKKSVQEGFHQELMRILSCLAVIPRNSYVTGVVCNRYLGIIIIFFVFFVSLPFNPGGSCICGLL